jgi:hypothetical protein
MIQRFHEGDLPLPDGWRLVDQSFLSKYRTLLTRVQVLDYFDGRTPGWDEALCPDIPRRPVVDRVLDKLSKSRQLNEGRVTVLLGAGGEGKSTALLQIAACLAADPSNWKVVWRDGAKEKPLAPEDIFRLPKSDATWLLVSDDADQIADGVFRFVAQRTDRRNDIQFLLSAQDVDWKHRRASGSQKNWKSHVRFEEIYMKGFMRGEEFEDARRIVTAWQKYQSEGLGLLQGIGPEDAARRLIKAAELAAGEYRTDGAFLGAMLDVRKGPEALEAHVVKIIDRLETKKVLDNHYDLLTPFVYVAFMHAEGFLFLTKQVLAQALSQPSRQCSPQDLDKEVIFRLKEEMAVSPASYRLLTRHTKIAQVAVKILQDRQFDPKYYFEELLRAANRLYAAQTEQGRRAPTQDYYPWKFWPDEFYKRGLQKISAAGRKSGAAEAADLNDQGEQDRDFGVRLARVLNELTPYDPRLINVLGRMLRETDQFQESVDLFRNSPEQARWERSFYHEWGMSEWQLTGNWAIKAWLCGVALADNGLTGRSSMERLGDRPDREERIIVGLAAIAKSFYHLYEQRGAARVFIKACGATAQLGRTLTNGHAAPEAREEVKMYLRLSREASVRTVDTPTAFEELKAGILEANKNEPYDLPQWVQRPAKLSFRQLAESLDVIS